MLGKVSVFRHHIFKNPGKFGELFGHYSNMSGNKHTLIKLEEICGLIHVSSTPLYYIGGGP